MSILIIDDENKSLRGSFWGWFYMRRSKNWIYGSSGAKKGRLRAFFAWCAAAVGIAFVLWGSAKYILGDQYDEVMRVVLPSASTTGEQTSPAPTTAPEATLPPPRVSDVKVKGLYVTAWSAGMEDRLAHYIELCDTTEVNALVIDVKDDRGQITFANSIEGAAGASSNIIADMPGLVRRLKEHDIYAIARVVCFKDPIWSKLHGGLAIQNQRGAPWKDSDGITWLDPYNKAAWAYIAAVAKEAARLGFDEVQLDYVRFPTGGRLGDIDHGEAGLEKTKAEIIAEFLAYIRTELASTDVLLSVDIFGITAVHKGDYEGIGQDLELLARHADYICPMVYPSHFANKRQNGEGQVINGVLYEAPDLQPFEVVRNTLLMMRNRLRAAKNTAGIRAYLQDFTASYLGQGYYQTYTAEKIREQVQAVYDAGLEEWILWNASGTYQEDALE